MKFTSKVKGKVLLSSAFVIATSPCWQATVHAEPSERLPISIDPKKIEFTVFHDEIRKSAIKIAEQIESFESQNTPLEIKALYYDSQELFLAAIRQKDLRSGAWDAYGDLAAALLARASEIANGTRARSNVETEQVRRIEGFSETLCSNKIP